MQQLLSWTPTPHQKSTINTSMRYHNGYNNQASSFYIPKSTRKELTENKKFKARVSQINPSSNILKPKESEYKILKQQYNQVIKKFSIKPQYKRPQRTNAATSRSRVFNRSLDEKISELSIRKQPLRLPAEQFVKMKDHCSNLIQSFQEISVQLRKTQKLDNQTPVVSKINRINLTQIGRGESSDSLPQKKAYSNQQKILHRENIRADRKLSKSGNKKKSGKKGRKKLSKGIQPSIKQDENLKGWETKNQQREQQVFIS